jgi:DNA-binding protein HU-beta
MAKTVKVNRTELIEELSTKLGSSKAQAEKFLNTFVGTITEQLKKGTEVNITGFGVFKKITRKARKGVNPKTREAMQIPASTSVSYKVGKTLKEAVKSSKK